MKELKFDIIFWDGEDPETIEHVTAEEAWAENYIEFKGNNLVAIDECTIIREWIGQKDKKDNEIYEGDIVRVDEHYAGDTRCKESNSEVIYSEGCFSVDYFGDGYWNWHSEIIGNIYENPELLEDK